MTHRLLRHAGLALIFVLGSCKGGPSDPGLPEVEIVVASGDGQYGTAGQLLSGRLHAVVRTVAGNRPIEETGVAWSVESGDAQLTTSAATLTDESGSAYMSIRLGNQTGEVVVRATVTEQETATVDFTLHVVDRPILESLSATSATAGASIVLTGANFSPTSAENVVLFSGIRGRVTSASAGELTVEVPRCLPTREVSVTARLGTVASNGLPLAVSEGAEVTTLAPGESIDVADDAGLTCLRMAGGTRYLAVVYSASTVAAAQHGYAFTGLADQSGGFAAAPAPPAPGDLALPGTPDLQAAWDAALRERETEIVREGVRRPDLPGPARAAAAVPKVGDRRTFNVFNRDRGFDEVEGVARYVGTHAALFVEETGASDFTDADLKAFADRFDDQIYPTLTAQFGNVSDLDGNERVVILFTATVNRLTPKGSAGFVGGFYFGIDLLPEREGSNNGEVFYTIVPDPNGAYSDPRPKSKLLEVVPGILAHEFQHMIHFNERILVLEATENEALWLSEGLALMAEELVARRYAALGDATGVELFRSGNLARAKRYLQNPQGVSLIYRSGQGTLQERGAGWLNLLYLTAQRGESVMGLMTRTTRTGVDNVLQHSGRDWPGFLSDWWAATYLDGSPVTRALEYPELDLETLLGDDYALDPTLVGATDFAHTGSLWSSSARYYIVTPPLGRTMALRLGGDGGGTSSSGAALRWRIIRVP